MKRKNLLKTLPLSLVLACASGNQAGRRALYTFESDASGFNTKSYFYDNGEEVVAIDSQFTPELARKSLEFLRSKTQNPVTYLIVTHPNPDKFNGISEFKKIGARVIASRLTRDALAGVHGYKKYYFVNMAKMFTEESYPKLETIDEVFDSSQSLELRNGERIELIETKLSGVSTNQTLVNLPRENSLIVGDLVHHKAHAWLEGGIIDSSPRPDIQGWIANLEIIQRDFSAQTLILGGRGESASLATVIPAQIAYLKKADKIVTDYVNELGNRRSELKTDQAGQHHKALAERFAKAFPDYSLGYMIEYGVYGLATSKL